MKIYLIPPSEAKAPWGLDISTPKPFFDISVSVEVAQSATEKDLKCKGARCAEAMEYNQSIYTSAVMPAIQRYTGVMYKALWYDSMHEEAKVYIEQCIYILSWLRGILRATDLISNYKLPISTKLAKYRKPLVTQYIIDQSPTEIVNLLPGSYMKMIDWQLLEEKWITIYTPGFRKPDGSIYTHGIKKVRGEWLRKESL